MKNLVLILRSITYVLKSFENSFKITFIREVDNNQFEITPSLERRIQMHPLRSRASFQTYTQVYAA